METRERNTSPYPNVPPVLESHDAEYNDAGVTSSINIAGHPIHPIIVTFPIAFLVAVMGSDLGYWFTKDVFWARASVWLIGLGLGSGLLAAIIGMSDFFKIKRVRERSAGWLHLYGNIIALLLTGVNLWIRQGNPIDAILPWGLTLSVTIATLLGVTGWFGGELSFRHKIGVIGGSSPDI